jgi:hypothetical protein
VGAGVAGAAVGASVEQEPKDGTLAVELKMPLIEVIVPS